MFFTFDISCVFFAASFAWAKTGKRMAARIAMIAMTTRSSMRVKALRNINSPRKRRLTGSLPDEAS